MQLCSTIDDKVLPILRKPICDRDHMRVAGSKRFRCIVVVWLGSLRDTCTCKCPNQEQTVQILYKAHYSPIANIRKSMGYSRRFWSSECGQNRGGVSLKSVLLVDDSKFMRMANEKALARAGYEVITASDGEEALRMAQARIPDLILLDMLLPKLGGPQVLQALKKNPLTLSIPVVVLSSLPQKNEVKLLKEGATAYFDKSTLGLDQHSESLIQIVNRILGEKTKQNGSAESCGLGSRRRLGGANDDARNGI